MGCRHERTHLARLIMADGRSQAVRVCDDCGGYADPRRPYLSKSEVPVPVEELPVWRDNRRPADDGARLF